MITVKGCTKYFNKDSVNEVRALNNISIEIQEGDFITVIGSNGSGKSTLLNYIAGSFLADSGQLLIDSNDVSNWPEYKRAKYIGRVFQDPLMGTFPSGSLEQNLSIALKRGSRRGLASGVNANNRSLFKERLAMLGLGLENRLDDQAGLLSGGQRQALTLIMATLVKPNVLLLDEHTAALDPKTAHSVLEMTKTVIEKDKLTTLMITHHMKQAIELGNRLIMMHQGQIVLDICGDEKKNLTVADLLSKFYEVQGEQDISDRMLFS